MLSKDEYDRKQEALHQRYKNGDLDAVTEALQLYLDYAGLLPECSWMIEASNDLIGRVKAKEKKAAAKSRR